MNIEDAKRIKINDNLWFSPRADKIVFGGTFLPPQYHLTISYGIKSGRIDMHLTSNEPGTKTDHFCILNVTHTVLINIAYPLLQNLQDYLFINQRELDIKWIKEQNFKVLALKSSERGISFVEDDDIKELLTQSISSKKTVMISEKNPNYKKGVNDLLESAKAKIENLYITPDEIKGLGEGYGILIGKESTYFFSTYSYFNDRKGFISDSINTSFKSVLKGVLTPTVFEAIENRISDGVKYLSGTWDGGDINLSGLTITLS